jgi:type IV pilus assembly protein PilE
MNTLQRKRIFGFTIIELMIVLVIVAILVALAYPSYIDYVRKSKRGEAQQLLMNWAVNMEIYRSNNPNYGSGTTPGAPAPTADHYNFTAADCSATAYTLTATAKSGDDQENDTAKDGVTTCTLTLNQNGVKLPANCWE